MVDEGKIEAEDVCVFDMTERVGGRLLSLRGLGPDDDLVVDAGGYRTWPEFTPTAHDLITKYLNIPMGCYDDSEPCQVYNIVDENGKKAVSKRKQVFKPPICSSPANALNIPILGFRPICGRHDAAPIGQGSMFLSLP